MVSSFFTRPPGLHPTPSACFPPPPPAKKGKITGTLTIVPQTGTQLSNTDIVLNVNNSIYNAITVIQLDWTIPELTANLPTQCLQTMPITYPSTRQFTPGNYNARVKCTWPNGQIRTFNYPYSTTTIGPPPGP